jgi:hypothetical protein
MATPGDICQVSGIYGVRHDKVHPNQAHQITMVKGKTFPPCSHCGRGVTYTLEKKTEHLG